MAAPPTGFVTGGLGRIVYALDISISGGDDGGGIDGGGGDGDDDDGNDDNGGNDDGGGTTEFGAGEGEGNGVRNGNGKGERALSAAEVPGAAYVGDDGATLLAPALVEVAGLADASARLYVGRLVAEDEAGSRLVVKEWTFRVLPRDADVDAYGPNGRGCGADGVPKDDEALDRRYVCACVSGLTGANCDQPVASAETGLGGGAAAGIAIAVLIIVALLCAGVYVYVSSIVNRWW